MNDMLIVYKELEDKITEDNYIDENDLLTILAENVAKSHLFDESVMYIDEFAGFTKQEYGSIICNSFDYLVGEYSHFYKW